MNKNKNIITLDGPACSGKGTLSAKLAQRLGWFHLDSGLLYRAVGFVLLQHYADPSLLNQIQVGESLKELQFEVDHNKLKIKWNHQLLGAELRTEEVSRWASVVASQGFIRQALLPIQRQFVEQAGHIIADGRDMGTTVFPDAQYKFFLVAPLEIRAQRRFEDGRKSNPDLNYETVLEHIKERDKRDTSRSVAPLQQANDAFLIETGILSIEDSLNLVLNLVGQG